MKLAIEYREGHFPVRFIDYCKAHKIDYKLVNCGASDIIETLRDCDALLWHWPHGDHAHELFARQLTYSLEACGKTVFPDSATCWHFDDKIGQKYLCEALELPLVKSWVFYDRRQALEWLNSASYPLVFKLKSGAGAQNVRLLHSRWAARRVVNRMFRRGIPTNDWLGFALDSFKKWLRRKGSWRSAASGVKKWMRSWFSAQPREYGYAYFQQFIAGNQYDIRCIVIGDKAFGIKRLCRKNDFRASGSGEIVYDPRELDRECVALSFEAAKKLRTQSLALDFVFDNGRPLIVEISYGFAMHGYDACPGYWDSEMNWHEGAFNPQEWMIENVVKKIAAASEASGSKE